MHLVVRRGVHEHIVRPVQVEELHLPLVDDGLLELLVRPVGPLQHGAGPYVLQLGPHKGAALAGLHVLELDDREEALR